MAYKWKPNKSQRREFVERMKDPEQKATYIERKRFNNSYEGFKDKMFIPSMGQYEFAYKNLFNVSKEHFDSFDQVLSAYLSGEKVSHEHIHIVNQYQRGELTF